MVNSSPLFSEHLGGKIVLTAHSPISKIKKARTHSKLSLVMQEQMALSQEAIPAVRGEYYSYSSVFTEERPIYALIKCKSNKARFVCEATNLGSEINALFQFRGENPRILSIKEADALGLLGGLRSKGCFGDTWFAPTSFTSEQFTELRDHKKVSELVRSCQNALTDRHVATDLREGLVVALMTDGGKYGMFLVEEITTSSIQIEACHILL